MIKRFNQREIVDFICSVLKIVGVDHISFIAKGKKAMLFSAYTLYLPFKFSRCR